MKVFISEGPPSSVPSAGAQQRSLVTAPPAGTTAACLLLLAFSGSSSSDDTPIGHLCLHRPSAAAAADRGCFAETYAVSLCLPAPPEERRAVGGELLWYAARHDSILRAGGALLARPAASAEDAHEELQSLGFVPAQLEDAADAADEADEATSSTEAMAGGDGPLLALMARRDPRDPPSDASHAALHVSSIERSLDFWSLLHFRPTRLFTTEGARAAWLSAPWSSLSLELIEVPALLQSACDGGGGAGAAAAAAEGGGAVAEESASSGLGLVHLCVDVTPLGVGLGPTLGLLQERSKQRFGRTLRVLSSPHQQMMGDLVAEVASVRAPDGVNLELVHRSATIARSMQADWSLSTESRE